MSVKQKTIIEKYKQYKDNLFKEVISLNSFYELYIHLKKKRNDRTEVISKAPAFFGLTEESLLTSTVIGISRIYEKRNKDGKNIYNFLDFVEANFNVLFPTEYENKDVSSFNAEISPRTIKKQRDKLEEKQSILHNLFTWRDKSFAHLDKKYFEERSLLGDDHPLRYEDLRSLIELVADILNKYEGLEGRSRSIKLLNITDIDRILDWLHRVEPYKIEINRYLRDLERKNNSRDIE